MVAVRMLLAIARYILVGIPTVLNKVYLLVTGIVHAAVAGPVLRVAGRRAPVDRTARIVAGALDDHRLRIDQFGRGIVSHIDTAEKAGLADTERYTCLRLGAGGDRQQGSGKGQGFH